MPIIQPAHPYGIFVETDTTYVIKACGICLQRPIGVYKKTVPVLNDYDKN